ncbi:hypothetical protein [Candidatus Uabimicrobium sp. HlEnr_7]|uniref:hypothetical protein n=1 Tax=Candidatus Uabimicrobium helgolandensis TaxID=3095367 RepID=UPI003558D314
MSNKKEMASKKGDLLGICIVVGAFIIAFTPPKLPKTNAQVNRYQFVEKDDVYFLDSHTGDLWIKGGTLNGVVQWSEQRIPNLVRVPKKYQQTKRYQLKFTKDNKCFLTDTSGGQIWMRSGTLNGVVQWDEQRIPRAGMKAKETKDEGIVK